MEKSFLPEKLSGFKIYRTAAQLPAIRFFDGLLKTGDLRYLLDCGDDLPGCDVTPLEQVNDSLLKEYDELTHKFLIKRSVINSADLAAQLNRINGLTNCYYLLTLGQKSGLDFLKQFGVSIENISVDSMQRLKRLILSEQTALLIDRDRLKKPENTSSFTDNVVAVIDVLKINIDENTVSLKKWISLEGLAIKKRIASGKQRT